MIGSSLATAAVAYSIIGLLVVHELVRKPSLDEIAAVQMASCCAWIE